MIKESYDFDAKRKARENLADVVAKQYSVAERKHKKVLTLMSHDSSELHQVWDKLGFNRKNIFVLERDPEIHQRIAENNWGVTLLQPQDVSTYFSSPKETFDIINLDYQGYFSMNRYNELIHMAQNGFLDKEGVLATWYSGRRESNFSKKLLLVLATDYLHNYYTTKYSAESLQLQTQEFIDNILIDGKSIDEIKFGRDVAPSIALSKIFDQNSNTTNTNYLGKFGIAEKFLSDIENLPSYVKRNQCFLHASESDIADYDIVSYELFQKVRKDVKQGRRPSLVDRWSLALRDIMTPEGIAIARKHAKPIMKSKIPQRILQKHPEILDYISKLPLVESGRDYTINEFRRLSYTSDTGTPMILDIGSLKKTDRILDMAFKYKANGKLRFHQSGWNKFVALQRSKEQEDEPTFALYLPRKHLTGSDMSHHVSTIHNPLDRPSNDTPANSVPKVPGDDLKSEAYSLLQTGHSIDEVYEKYKNTFTKRQISAFKAWVTMKSRQTARDLESTVSKETDEVVPIEKKEIIPYLALYGVDEVAEAYPHVSRGTLKAYMAHITMGRYNDLLHNTLGPKYYSDNIKASHQP